jgi:hypothetical protein
VVKTLQLFTAANPTTNNSKETGTLTTSAPTGINLINGIACNVRSRSDRSDAAGTVGIHCYAVHKRHPTAEYETF